MAATDRPRLGVRHVTVVPTNFTPEPSREMPSDEDEDRTEDKTE